LVEAKADAVTVRESAVRLITPCRYHTASSIVITILADLTRRLGESKRRCQPEHYAVAGVNGERTDLNHLI
jgi:hypothetical protein